MPHFSSVVVCHNYTVIENVALIKLNLNHYCCVMTYYKFITQQQRMPYSISLQVSLHKFSLVALLCVNFSTAWAISANVNNNFGLFVTHYFIYICSGSLLYQHSIFNCGISWSQWKETKLWSSSQKNIAKRDSKTVDQKLLGLDSNVGH